jgi:hypothetical protein
MKFSRFYESGAVMGFAPAQVDAMSLWEFAACVDGYRAAHGGARPGRGEGISEARARDLGLEGF